MEPVTILSAQYSNPDGTAVRAMTVENATVIITQSPDKAERWAALQEWVKAGGVIEPFPLPPPPPKTEVEELREALLRKGILTTEDLPTRISDARG